MRCSLWLIGCCLFMGVLAGCAGDDHGYAYGYGFQGDGHEVPYDHEYRGYQGAYHESGYFVVQRPEVWKALWGGQPPANVDFSKQTVAAMMGRQPTEGYAIRINEVRDTGKRINAFVTTTRPDAKNNQKQETSYPFHMLVMPKLTTPVYFTVAGTTTQPVAIQDLYEGVQGCCTQAHTAVIHYLATWHSRPCWRMSTRKRMHRI